MINTKEEFYPTNTPYRNRRQQSLTYSNGYKLIKVPEMIPTEEEDYEIESIIQNQRYGGQAPPPNPFVPNFIRLDKKTLKFDGYVKEKGTGSLVGTETVRLIELFYHLEDDTITIKEPPTPNSGMWQGKLLGRFRVPKPGTARHYHWTDLNTGIDVQIYARTYRLCTCDRWSRDFLREGGIKLNPFEELPLEKPGHLDKTPVVPQSAGPRREFKLKNLIEKGGQILRFYCLWDDRKDGGSYRRFELRYYLVDETVEVKEVYELNGGREPYPLLLHRQKLPKRKAFATDYFPSVVHEMGAEDVIEYYGPTNFAIGKVVNVLGRPFVIYDMDNYTKGYYTRHFGTTDFTPLELPKDRAVPIEREVPEYTGFGDPEDSLGFWKSFMPVAPKKDMFKQMTFDKKALRYKAIFCDLPTNRTDGKVDNYEASRNFVVSYNLGDDTVSIQEQPSTGHSGFLSSRFLSRRKVLIPGSTLTRPEYFEDKHFYPGAKLLIFNHNFALGTGDMYSLRYITEHPERYSGQVVESAKKRIQEEDEFRNAIM